MEGAGTTPFNIEGSECDNEVRSHVSFFASDDQKKIIGEPLLGQRASGRRQDVKRHSAGGGERIEVDRQL